MKYGLRQSSQFKKDFKNCIKRGLDLNEFKKVLELLVNAETIPAKYRDHQLQPSKDYKNCRELHIQLDWLLIYRYSQENVILYLVRTGSHSDLFE